MKYFDKSITIEDLTDMFPGAIPLLSKFGIRCLICGEPSWGTLEEAAVEKGITGKELDDIVMKLNREYEISKGQNPHCKKP